METSRYQKWLKKRKLTTIAFAIQNILLGFEYSVVIVNMWIYIEKLVQPNHPKLYYSMIYVGSMLSSALLSIVTSKIADRYRNIKTIFIVTNGLIIVGNLIYMIPFSPWILLGGRILAGAGHGQLSVIAGEIARTYPQSEMTSKFSLMGMCNAIGFMIAPIVNIAFKQVKIDIGKMHINFSNLSGIYLPIIYVIAQIMVVFMIHNLSKEYDQKYEEEKSKLFNDSNIIINSNDENQLFNQTISKESYLKAKTLIGSDCKVSCNDPKTDAMEVKQQNDIPVIVTSNDLPIQEQNDKKIESESLKSKNNLKEFLASPCKYTKKFSSCETTQNQMIDNTAILPKGLSLNNLFMKDSFSNILHTSCNHAMGSCSTLKANADHFTEAGERQGIPFTKYDNNSSERGMLASIEEESSLKWLCKQIILNVDTALLMGVSFLESFLIISLDMVIPIIVIDILNWSMIELNIITMGTGLASIIPCLVLLVRKFSDAHVFYASVFSVFVYAIIQFIQILLTIYSSDATINVVLVVIYCLLFANVMIIKDVFLGCFLAQMVSSIHQSLTDSIRQFVSRIGAVTAVMVAPFALEKVEIIGWIYIFVILLFTVLLMLRRKTLKSPNVIIHGLK